MGKTGETCGGKKFAWGEGNFSPHKLAPPLLSVIWNCECAFDIYSTGSFISSVTQTKTCYQTDYKPTHNCLFSSVHLSSTIWLICHWWQLWEEVYMWWQYFIGFMIMSVRVWNWFRKRRIGILSCRLQWLSSNLVWALNTKYLRRLYHCFIEICKINSFF